MKKLVLFSVLALTSMFVQAQLTYTVTVPSGTNACYIAGGMNGWSQQEMTLISPLTYSITIPTATTAHQYKYCSGPNWAYEEKQADCTSAVQNRTYAANDVVACWAAVFVPAAPKVDVTIKAKMPATWITPKIHFWGDMSSAWPGENMTQDGDWWVYTFNQINIINIIFNNGAGSQTSNITNVSASTCYQVNADNSYQVVSCAPVVQDYVYNVTVPSGTFKCYVVGEFNGWASFSEMTQLTPTTYTITINTATPDGYKFTSGPSWDYEELQGNGSAVANRTYSQDNTVALWKAVFDPTLTSVENQTGSTFVKGVRSGIHIETSGQADLVVYSLQGSLLKQTQLNQRGQISDLQAGVYLLKINGQTFKAIVQ